jgi:2-phosphoglycerate kinase
MLNGSHPYKPIVLLGGTAGTGKSSLANRLCALLGLDHRIGTGFIRAVVCSESSPERDPELFSFTFRADDPIAHLRIQAERLQPAIMACIRRAREEGTSLIVEGPHLLPALYADAHVDTYVMLAAPPPIEHRNRLLGPTHSLREITDGDWRNARLIDSYLASQAAAHGIRRVLIRDNLEEIADMIRHGVPAPR